MFVITLILSILVSSSSLACMMEKPLTEKIKSQANLVFVGHAVVYTDRPKFDIKSQAPWKPAIIRFKVEKVIKGSKISEVEVYWINGTFGESKTLQDFIRTYGEHTEVGIQYVDKIKAMKDFKDKPWVVQGPCTKPFMSMAK